MKDINKINELIAVMKSEAERFGICAKIHGKKENESAAKVAERADELLTRFAYELELIIK